MSGLSIKLPLQRDSADGISLNKNYKELVKQNLKNLLLTVKGERVMLPDFGCGLTTYLFELENISVRSQISSMIQQQVSRYLPFIEIDKMFFGSQVEDPNVDANTLKIRIEYRITPLDELDRLDLEFDNNELLGE